MYLRLTFEAWSSRTFCAFFALGMPVLLWFPMATPSCGKHLMSHLSEVADTTASPQMSRLYVALFHFHFHFFFQRGRGTKPQQFV
jgi:hypothetical protein